MEPSNIKKFINVAILLIVILIIVGAWKGLRYGALQPDSAYFQMVYLKNDQVYFGKFHDVFSPYPYLTDVYYTKPQLDQRGRPIDNSFQLIRRGEQEIHAPLEAMYIPRENINYWENVGGQSRIMKAIVEEKNLRERTLF